MSSDRNLVRLKNKFQSVWGFKREIKSRNIILGDSTNPEYGKGSCSEGSSICSNETIIIRWNVRGVKMVKQLKMSSTNNKYKPAIFALV